MATNIEIEAKALIKEQDYNNLIKEFEGANFTVFDQTNYYVETKIN